MGSQDSAEAGADAVPSRGLDEVEGFDARARSAIVVGAGIVGVSIAWRLTRSGWDVTLVEAFAPGHARAASGGPSRMIRMASGDDDEVAESSVRAVALWDQIGAETGTPLFVRSGFVYFGDAANADWYRASIASHEALGVPYALLDEAEARSFYPSLNTEDVEHFLYEPEGGFVLARSAVQLLVADARSRGMRLLDGMASRQRDAVVVDGDRLEADAVVWAVGGWTQGAFPELVKGVWERHDLVTFGVDHRWRSPGIPAWTDAASDFSGMGDVDGAGFRLGGWFHEPADIDGPMWIASELQQRAARDLVSHRFPDLARATLTGAIGCQSTAITAVLVEPLTVVGGARIWKHPAEERVWIVGDGSESLFKHGPDIGWQVEMLLSRFA